MVWDRNEVSKFLRKLYRELESETTTFKFEPMVGYRGMIEWRYYQSDSPREFGLDTHAHIRIDHRDELIPTLIHECIHRIYPKWSEEMVVTAEKRIMKHITARQAKTIIKKFANSL